jgi:GT2 family glycosyltransferase
MKNIKIVKSKAELGDGLYFNIEGLKRAGNMLMLHGWVVDPLRRLQSMVANPPGVSKPIELRDKLVRFHRPDVNAAYSHPTATLATHYGFVVLLQDIPDVGRLENLGVAFVAGNGNTYIESVQVQPLAATVENLPSFMGIVTDMHIDAARCENYYWPLFKTIATEAEQPVEVFDETFGPVSDFVVPTLSVIIPLYGNTRFEATQIPAWAALGRPDWEIILALDDPSIIDVVRENVRRLTSLYGCQVRVMAPDKNLGFSGINNFAAERAKGEYILFLNSDCFVGRTDPILKALEWLKTEHAGAVGFRLTYADCSVQHDGMSISKWNNDEHFLLNEHPRRGLPVNLISQRPADDDACMVTAACLLVSNQLFHSVGGFDRAYLRGDFEDSDLCLKLISDGYKLGIVRDHGIFHLERQTIAAQEGGLRQKITLVNSFIYTKKWRAVVQAGVPALEVIV